MSPNLSVDGWHSMALIPAGRAREHRALAEIAAQVDRGLVPPDTPVFVATKRMDSPYPDVVVGVPLTDEEVAAWRRGDRSVARDVVEALEDALADFMRHVASGRMTR